MTKARDGQGRLLPDAERMTGLGTFLRRSSLDELPELINILRGEMSVIGPRPLLMSYLDRYSSKQMRRHNVKPGLTGWAQVNGRNSLGWQTRLDMDSWYADHLSLSLDLKILLMTFWKVLIREGISHPGHVTMEEFRGNVSNGVSQESWTE
jgi:sugar transferase EpsL